MALKTWWFYKTQNKIFNLQIRLNSMDEMIEYFNHFNSPELKKTFRYQCFLLEKAILEFKILFIESIS